MRRCGRASRWRPGSGPHATYACVDAWLTDFRGDLPKIDVPTLVVHGRRPTASCPSSPPRPGFAMRSSSRTSPSWKSRGSPQHRLDAPRRGQRGAPGLPAAPTRPRTRRRTAPARRSVRLSCRPLGAHAARRRPPWGLRPGPHAVGHGERGCQFAPGPDPELGEHVAQVPLDGARAEEQAGADLGVREPVAGELGDLALLRR